MNVKSSQIWWSLVALVLVTELGSAAWRLAAEQRAGGSWDSSRLRFSIPADRKGGFAEAVIDPRQVGDLSFDRGSRYLLRPHPGIRLELLYLEYDAGNEHISSDLLIHKPQYCMRNAGAVVTEVFPPLSTQISGESLSVESVSIASLESKRSYILKAIWYPQQMESTLGFARSHRIHTALSFRPRPPALILMGGVHGAESFEEAWQIFQQHGLACLSVQPTGSRSSSP